jgi:predicted RNA-binding Zn ribbon-like protein
MTKDYRAPDSLELVRLFVNSLDLDHPDRDPFLSAEGARAWLIEHGISRVTDTDEERASARELREALRDELLAHSGAEAEDEGESWERLATLLQGTGLEVVFDSARGVSLGPPPAADGLQALRATIASRVYDAVRGGEWRRLKACRKETCLFAFYDRSKNGSGTWCDMAVCGNRVKAQRRRARERVPATHEHSYSD